MSPSSRLPIPKTFKLYIGGVFPRTESGRTFPVRVREPGDWGEGRIVGHGCRASRKDVRDAVGAARKAQPGWASASPYLRGQILYRLAEMVEGQREAFAALIDARAEGIVSAGAETGVPLTGEAEVSLAIDRLVAFAGWADKYQQVLGCQNAVNAPYWNITVPEPTGVIGVCCPANLPLLALVSLVAPVVCAGGTVVVVTPADPAVVCALAEACATSDLPGGVINLLTGDPTELGPVMAGHRDIDGLHAAVGPGISSDLAKTLEQGRAENLKRVTVRGGARGGGREGEVDWTDSQACHAPSWIEAFVEYKTVWHPTGV